MTTAAVVSAYPAVRAGLALLLEGEDIRVLAQAADLPDLQLSREGMTAEVVVIDLPPGALPDGLAEVRGGARPLLLGPAADDDRLSEMFGGTPWGYTPRQSTGEEIAAAVRAVAAGLVVVHPALADRVLGRPLAPAGSPPAVADNALSAREREVLQLVAEGLPNKTIATRLSLSEHTVKFHIQAILTKLGASSRTEAVRIGARRGLVIL